MSRSHKGRSQGAFLAYGYKGGARAVSETFNDVAKSEIKKADSRAKAWKIACRELARMMNDKHETR